MVTLDDTVDEAGETVNLTLSNPLNTSLGARSTAQLSIADNDQADLCSLFTVPVDDSRTVCPAASTVMG